jgi:iron complex transport system permease protein
VALPACAFAFALGTTVLIYALSHHRGQVQVATMLLAGIAINSLAGAITGFALFKANDDQLRDITFWTLGSLARVSWDELKLLALPMLLCLAALPLFARVLNALLLSEDDAVRLGFPVQRAKRLIIVFSAFAVAGCVAMTGLIGFVGLVVPHLVRLCIGPDHRFLLIASPILGAALLVIADVLARVTVAPAELPIGVVTALLGAPFFLALLLSRRRQILG